MSALPGATDGQAGDSVAEPRVDAPTDDSSSSRGERIARLGTIISAIMASSCCWVPALLILLGFFGFSTIGMAQSLRSGLETYRPLFMVVTFGFLGMAFYFTYRPRRTASGSAENC